MTDTKSTLSAAQLLQKLKSEKPEERSEALDLIFGGETVMLIKAGAFGTQTAGTKRADLLQLFTALVLTAQNIAQAMGVRLQWIQDKSVEAAKGGLVLPGHFK